MAATLEQTWEDFYEQSQGDTVLKDTNFFRLELVAIKAAMLAFLADFAGQKLRVLELGCGTGALAQVLTEAVPAKWRDQLDYTGIDFSVSAIRQAERRGLAGAQFVAGDFLVHLERDDTYDLIVSQRVVMAIIDPEQQNNLLKRISARLVPGGQAMLSEGTQRGADRVDDLRRQIGIEPMGKIWHCLYLDDDKVHETFSNVRMIDFASQYWLITRVIYPFAGEPQHNTPLHDFAASLPQTEDYGLVKLIVADNSTK